MFLSGEHWGINMNYIFSAKNNAFYPISLQSEYEQAGSWPEDGIEIADNIVSEFMVTAPAGKMRVVVDGMPAWIDIPPPSHEQLIEQAEQQKSALLTAANNAIAPLQDAVDLEMATDDEQPLLLAWKKYRVLLNRVDTSAAPDIEWPTQPGERAS